MKNNIHVMDTPRDIDAALRVMDEVWTGYDTVKGIIRRHVEELESAVVLAHWAIWKDVDIEGALKVLVGTGLIPMRPLLSKGRKKAIKGKAPCRK